MPENLQPQQPADHTVSVSATQARVRRSPKYVVFLVLGAVIGVFAAMISTFAFDGTQANPLAPISYSQGQVFGFLSLIFGSIGLAIGGAVALVLDRILAKRARTVSVERETFEELPADGVSQTGTE